jgi:hypothetical protein
MHGCVAQNHSQWRLQWQLQHRPFHFHDGDILKYISCLSHCLHTLWLDTSSLVYMFGSVLERPSWHNPTLPIAEHRLECDHAQHQGSSSNRT